MRTLPLPLLLLPSDRWRRCPASTEDGPLPRKQRLPITRPHGSRTWRRSLGAVRRDARRRGARAGGDPPPRRSRAARELRVAWTRRALAVGALGLGRVVDRGRTRCGPGPCSELGPHLRMDAAVRLSPHGARSRSETGHSLGRRPRRSLGARRDDGLPDTGSTGGASSKRMRRCSATAAAIVMSTPEAAERLAGAHSRARGEARRRDPERLRRRRLRGDRRRARPTASSASSTPAICTRNSGASSASAGSSAGALGGTIDGVDIYTRSHVYLLEAVDRLRSDGSRARGRRSRFTWPECSPTATARSRAALPVSPARIRHPRASRSS